MKKISIAAIAVFFTVVSASAQNADLAAGKNSGDLRQYESLTRQERKQEKKELRKLEGQEVSYQSKEQFYRDFGDVPVSQWTRTSYFDEVSFVEDGESKIAFYDITAQLVGTTSRKTFTDIPDYAQKYISNKYKDYTVKAVVYYEDNQDNDMDMVMYGTQFEDSDMYFVELSKGSKQLILKVDPHGEVSYFTQLG